MPSSGVWPRVSNVSPPSSGWKNQRAGNLARWFLSLLWWNRYLLPKRRFREELHSGLIPEDGILQNLVIILWFDIWGCLHTVIDRALLNKASAFSRLHTDYVVSEFCCLTYLCSPKIFTQLCIVVTNINSTKQIHPYHSNSWISRVVIKRVNSQIVARNVTCKCHCGIDSSTVEGLCQQNYPNPSFLQNRPYIMWLDFCPCQVHSVRTHLCASILNHCGKHTHYLPVYTIFKNCRLFSQSGYHMSLRIHHDCSHT
jgi:hypothetical protein